MRILTGAGERFTATIRNTLFMYGSQWVFFKPVTPRAYAHRLESVLNPVPENEIPWPRDPRVIVRGGPMVAAYVMPVRVVQPSRHFVIDGIKETDE